MCIYTSVCVCVCSKVNIWNVNCARETTFISTHERMFLWKCRSFWDRNCFYLRGTRIPNLRIQAEYSNHLNYHGQTFAVPSHVFNAGLGGIDTFCSKVTIWNVPVRRGQQHSFSTHGLIFLWKCRSFWNRKYLHLRGGGGGGGGGVENPTVRFMPNAL